MKTYAAFLMLMVSALVSGCSGMDSLGGGPTYGESSGTVANQTERQGRIDAIEIIEVDEDYKFGVGTAVGAVAGGLLGSKVGDSTAATVAGAAIGAAAGTYAESRMNKTDAQRVTVLMGTGGQVTIDQPVDSRLEDNMNVWVVGSGETARVVPR